LVSTNRSPLSPAGRPYSKLVRTFCPLASQITWISFFFFLPSSLSGKDLYPTLFLSSPLAGLLNPTCEGNFFSCLFCFTSVPSNSLSVRETPSQRTPFRWRKVLATPSALVFCSVLFWSLDCLPFLYADLFLFFDFSFGEGSRAHFEPTTTPARLNVFWRCALWCFRTRHSFFYTRVPSREVPPLIGPRLDPSHFFPGL